MFLNTNRIVLFLISGSLSMTSCQKKEDEVILPASNYLYVASGICFAGAGMTTFTAVTASNLVFRINTSTGTRDSVLVDYASSAGNAGDTPTGVVDWDTSSVLVSVGNGTTGRIDKVAKVGGAISAFSTNPSPATIFSAMPRGMIKANDGGLLVIKSGAIEKLTSAGMRLPGPPGVPAAASYIVNDLGATCGTVNTTYTSIVTTPTLNNLLTAHAFLGTNRLISLPATGGNKSCTSAQSVPGAGTEWPTAMVYDSDNNKLIVAYASNAITANSNLIVVYDYDETTGTISNPQTIYDVSLYPSTYNYILFGISSMLYDKTNHLLYVATATSTAAAVVNYAIEKFTYDYTKLGVTNDKVLTRSGTSAWYDHGHDTKCISSMTLGN